MRINGILQVEKSNGDKGSLDNIAGLAQLQRVHLRRTKRKDGFLRESSITTVHTTLIPTRLASCYIRPRSHIEPQRPFQPYLTTMLAKPNVL